MHEGRRTVHIQNVTMSWADGGSFTFFGLPAVAFWLDPSLTHLLVPLARALGRERYRELVRSNARRGAAEDYHAMVTVLADNFPEGFRAWGLGVSVAGWGAFELTRFDRAARVANVRVTNPWELQLGQAGDEFGCPFLLGKLEGIFGRALGGECWGRELPVDADTTGGTRVEFVLECGAARELEPAEPPSRLVAGPSSSFGALGLVAGGIAHTFNNRLAAILGCLSMAQAHAGRSGPLGDLLDRAAGHCQQARQLALKLVTLSAGGAPCCRAVDVAAVLSRAIEAATGGDSRWPVPYRVEPQLAVRADPDQLERAVAELVRNACEAMPQGGAIELVAECCPGEPWWRVIVRDGGPGLSPDECERAMELFYTTKPGAAGLGLCVARSVAQRHTGRLELDAVDGGGLEARLILPRGQPDGSVEELAPLPAGLRVLVVDDDSDVLEIGCEMLRHLGCVAVAAHSVDEALALHRGASEPFALALVDLIMPGAGGLALLAELAVDSRLRLIACSGYHDAPVMSDPAAHRAAAVLSKPYQLAELEQALRRALA